MSLSRLAAFFWGERAQSRYLWLAAFLLLFTFLGQHDIWTQEHRWADIVAGMFYRHDFLHPYLGTTVYYDKPLLSYWLIAALVKLTGIFNTVILRLPSACAGLITLFSIYRLGYRLKNREFGLLAAWLLLTTFYFLFWARISSADMLNMAGSLFAVMWYVEKRDQPGLLNYAIFFLVLALTALCKGLGGIAVPMIAIVIDVALQRAWTQHLRLSALIAILPALVVYLLPFWLSAHFNAAHYQESGLYLVYRENILRYFQPFDHEGSIYTYVINLPLYTLPWAFFLIPALCRLPWQFRKASLSSKWITLSTFCLFLFFTLSGSRRNYYILPVVPFAILMIADWLSERPLQSTRQQIAALLALCMACLLWLAVDIVPAWYYTHIGVRPFSTALKAEASQQMPWSDWHVVMLDGESKLNFYLDLPPNTPNYSLKQIQPMLAHLHLSPHTIYISTASDLALLKPYFAHYQVLSLRPHTPFALVNKVDTPIAFIPT